MTSRAPLSLRAASVALPMLLAGCHLVFPHGAADGPRSSEAAEREARAADADPGDRPLSDAAPAEAGDGPRRREASVTSDLAVYRPITAAELAAAWKPVTVPCVDEKGQPAGASPIGILENAVAVSFVQGSVTLAAAVAETKAWAGVQPAVTVIWDPSMCGIEDAWNGTGADGEWAEAGFLIRGATLDGQGRLLLAPGAAMSDLDVLDVSSSGGFEAEVFGADDAGLATFPNAGGTVTAAKKKLLELAAAPP
jgi:hypothetical protein